MGTTTTSNPVNNDNSTNPTNPSSSATKLDIGQGVLLELPERNNLIGGLKIEQKFSDQTTHPYDQVEWELRDIAIFDFKKGKNAYERNGVEVPKFWDSNAAQTTVSKYLFGNSPDTPEYENSLKNAFDRIANTYTIWGWKHGYFLDLESAKTFNWELKYMLVNQIWSPNSPVWFNIGHWEQWRWGRPDLRESLGGNLAFKAFIDENNELILKELKNSFEHPQASACQPGWALINTEIGLIPIKEIHERNLKGLRVMDSRGTTRILATKNNGKKQVYKVHFQDGRFIEATSDHLVATFKERKAKKIRWKSVAELTIGDIMRLHNECNLLEVPKSASEKEVAEAFLAGWNQADGCTAQYNSGNKSIIMEWVALDDEEENALRSAISVVFPQTSEQKEKGENQKRSSRGGIHEDNTPHLLKDGRRLRRVRISGKYLKEFAEKYELFNRKLDIRVPRILWNAPLNAVHAYLKGAFQGDGFVTSKGNSHYVSISTISQQWMDDVQILLTRCGIYSRIQNYNEPRQGRHDTRTVTIGTKSERLKFAELIGFVNKTKNEKLKSSLKAKGKNCRVTKHLEIVKIEEIGIHEVFDIQTESEQYLTNGVLVHNCFLTGVEDSMEAILQHQIAEGRIFSSGSGVGINISSLRSSKEPIAGKGKSSGPISFDKGWDKMAGAIKSGGKCLAPWQQVYTENGPVEVRELANRGNFVGLSYDPMAGRIMAKRGQAWMAGIKEVVEIITDKGTFALSTDHPVRTADHQVVEAGKLRKGMHLHAGAIDMGTGYLRVHLQNGKKGKAHLHRMIAQDILGHNLKGLHVHHKDENKLNNSLENLEILTAREHHQHHNQERVAAGEHAFQKNKYPKPGKSNPMHSTAKFWGTKEAKAYRKLQGEILKRSGRASEMQGESTKQRMLNKLWETSNAGGDISNFEAYYRSRKKLIGRLDSKKRLESDVKKHFGSFSGMLEEMNAKNHTVIEVRNLGVMETYDVEITCPSPDDKTAASGHNFLIWSNTNSGLTGSGIFVLNTRRAARMTLMDSNHPDIMTFVNLKNEQEHLAKVILREHNSHVQLKAKAEKTLNDPKATVSEQLAAEFILSLPLVTNEEYSGAMDGIVYGETISNQNANHSVSLLGDFWDAYYSKGNYSTRWVTKPDKIDATFPASDLLSAMAKSVYDNAEPGCHNNDWINLWSPYKSVERLTTSNPCITGDSLVATKGLNTIKSLVGKTPIVKGSNNKSCKASAVFETGRKRTYRLQTASGYHLDITGDHLVSTTVGDIAVKNLTTKHQLILQGSEFGNKAVGTDLAYLIGYAVGDGCVTVTPAQRTLNWTFGNAEKNEGNRVLAMVNAIKAQSRRKDGNLDTANGLVKTETGWRVNTSKYDIVNKAENMAILDKGSKGKELTTALELNKEDMSALLSGLFDADGTVGNYSDKSQYISLDSISERLLEQVQVILLGYGIKSKIYRDRKKKSKAMLPDGKGGLKEYTIQKIHSLRISRSSRIVFEREINFRSPEKKKKLRAMNSSVSTYKDEMVDRVKSVTYIGKRQVYDLTEPVTSHFTANGILIHNCSEYLAPVNTSCNLSSFNAYRFLDKDTKEIKTDLLEHGALLAMIVADLNIEEGGFPIPEIARETYNYRTTGVGYGNIGGLLMSLGIPYDSDEGRWMAGAMMSLLTAACWKASFQMGREYGAYRKHPETKHDLTKVLDLHIASDALLAKLPGLDHDKVEDIISKGPNNSLPTWGSLNGRSALRALASSFNLDTPWDETMISPARKVAQAATAVWREVKKEMKSGKPRNSFVSLTAPGGCLVENSLILTGSGLKRLRRMGNPGGAQWQEIEEKVQTDEGPQAATKFYINGKAETRIIQTERLLEIQGTGSHRVKKLNPDTLELEWIKLKDIKKGDILASKLGGMFGPTKTVWLPKLPMLHHNNTSGTTAPEVMTEELAEFVGLFCGDGSLHQRSVRIACTMEDKDLTAYILDLGKKLFNLKGKVNPKKKGQQSVSVDFYSHPIATWMAACGFQKHGNREGKKSKKPYIPDAILETNDPKIYGAFLRGLAEADGTVGYKGNPTIATHYAPFAQEIMVLMLALGMAPSMDDCTISGHSGTPLYRVSLLNHDYLPIWKKYVGFISDRKSGKQDNIPQRSFSRNDTIPVSTEWLRKAKQEVRNQGGLSAALRKGVLTKNTARQIIKIEQNSDLGKKLKALLGYVFTPALDNKDGGVQYTYDLSVPSNVTYLANGFISHNTISAPLGIYDQGTTAIEPDYTLVKYKVLAGGGMLKMFNKLALEGLRSVGYSEWHVHEAAFEVAGLNGLYVACLGNVDAVVKHLVQPPKEQAGPVRESYKSLDASSPAYQDPHTMVHQLVSGNTQGLPDVLVNGKGHVEQIPWLSDHHRAIFDCAATTGDGVRSIKPTGHIKMLGAIQPFISGASSKTVNLPYYATVEDILECFEMSHKLGVKCIALYRDGSKGVSVYQTNSPESQKWIVDNIWKKTVESIESKTNEIVAKASVPRRKKLDGRRWSQVVKFGIAGQGNLEGFLIVGMYPDGTCGEVFGKLGQGGSFAHGMFESFCKAFSVMLQWGVPFPQAIGTFKSMAFDPSGFTKVGDPDSEHARADIKSCKSVVDLVMQILKWMFPEENGYKIRDLKSSEIHLTSTLVADQRPAMMPPTLGAPYGEQKPTVTKVEPLDLGSAETCQECGSLSVIQDGKCRRCCHCGYSAGSCTG